MRSVRENLAQPTMKIGSNKNRYWIDFMTEENKDIKHIAIIPDGNRRWARLRNLPTLEGHKKGILDVSPKIITTCFENKIHTITLWLFSTENWNRSTDEVEYLMEIISEFIKIMLKISSLLRIKLKHLGRKDRIPDFLIALIEKAENETDSYDSHQLNFCIDYGGRDEIVRAVKSIVQNNLDIEEVNEKTIGSLMDTGNLLHKDPDVVFRTSGEQRLSGFMSWQSCYSELFFINKHYPDLVPNDIIELVRDFEDRHRRFGK